MSLAILTPDDVANVLAAVDLASRAAGDVSEDFRLGHTVALVAMATAFGIPAQSLNSPMRKMFHVKQLEGE